MSRKLVHLITIVLVAGLIQTSLGNVLDPDLVGWWKFDEGSGTAAADSSGSDMHGVLVNDPEWRDDGPRKGCLFFDGDDAYVQVPHQDALNPSDGSFTVVFWASVEVAAGARGDANWDLPVAKRDSGSIGYYVGADRNQGSADQTGYRFMLGDTAANRKDTPYVSVPLGEWVFVAAVLDRDRDEQKISVDGGQTWETTTPPAGAIAPARDLGIGWDIGQNNYWVHGRIDDVALFSRALSDGQIGLIMQEGMTPALAKDSHPRDGAIDVPLDVTLNWAPGLYAATHDLYFGTSSADVSVASRADPLGALVIQGQTATTYEPDGPLEFGQTYYWRIDEVNAAPDSTIFTGEVWSFTVEPFAYPIENIIATSNAESRDGFGPERTVDGSGLNAEDQHSVVSGDMWAGTTGGAEPVSIQYAFDRVYKLHQMRVWNYNVEFELMLGFGFKDVTVEYSENGIDWTILKEVQFAQATAKADYTANTIVDLEGVPAQYVRLTANSAYGLMGQFGLGEVRILYVPIQASEPEPADGATEVDVKTMLDWRGGRQAASHEIYFGTDPEALALVDTVPDSRYDPDRLDLGTTYYWQISEVNEAEAISTWEGQIWSFSTLEYIVVDDFESYTDYSPRSIFQIWIDGWGFEEDDFFPHGNDGNGSGAQVGYLEAPFAEETIVHGGHQSMPLMFNNSVPLGYSEAERSFEVSQDWTLYGTETLTVYFRGTLDNNGQLYAKINNIKVPYNDDATHIASMLWRPWNIDLSTVGGNMTNIRTLAIGVEGADAAGILYIDDIRLYRKPPDTLVPVEPDSAHLIARYALDGDVSDSSGNGYHGEAVGDPTYGSGVHDQAIQFDGVDDHIRIAHQDSLNPSAGSFSVALWAYLDSASGASGTSNWDLVVAKRDTASAGYYIGADRNQGNANQAGYKFMLGNAAGNRVDTPYLPVLLGEWVFVATVLDRDQNVHKISVDGGQNWATTTPPSGSIAPAQDLGIGWDIGQDNYWVHGAVDEVRLYNQALSDEEVAWLASN